MNFVYSLIYFWPAIEDIQRCVTLMTHNYTRDMIWLVTHPVIGIIDLGIVWKYIIAQLLQGISYIYF